MRNLFGKWKQAHTYLVCLIPRIGSAARQKCSGVYWKLHGLSQVLCVCFEHKLTCDTTAGATGTEAQLLAHKPDILSYFLHQLIRLLYPDKAYIRHVKV